MQVGERDVQVPAAARAASSTPASSACSATASCSTPRCCARSSTSSQARGRSAAAACASRATRTSSCRGTACSTRPREAAPRRAPDRHDAARHRAGLRRQGRARRHPRAGPARHEDPAREDRDRARAQERAARLPVRHRPARRARRSRPPPCATPSALAPYIADVSLLVNEALDRGENVLFEGAQGTLLDLDHGTYPFVTSSNPIAGGACVGARHRPDAHRRRRRRRQGVPHARRRGPVPDRGRRRAAARSCARRAASSAPSRAARGAAAGSTSSALRYAARVNGFTELVLTKLDVLSAVEEIPVCVAYRLRDGSGERALPGAPVRLPPRRAGVGDARGLGRADRRRAARSLTCRRRRSAMWRSWPSALACRSGLVSVGPRRDQVLTAEASTTAARVLAST